MFVFYHKWDVSTCTADRPDLAVTFSGEQVSYQQNCHCHQIQNQYKLTRKISILGGGGGGSLQKMTA